MEIMDTSLLLVVTHNGTQAQSKHLLRCSEAQYYLKMPLKRSLYTLQRPAAHAPRLLQRSR